jgi:hypothetical protein
MENDDHTSIDRIMTVEQWEGVQQSAGRGAGKMIISENGPRTCFEFCELGAVAPRDESARTEHTTRAMRYSRIMLSST